MPAGKLKMLTSALKLKPEWIIGRSVSESTMYSNITALALNDEGQHRLIEYGDDLVSSGKYIKSGSDRLVEEA